MVGPIVNSSVRDQTASRHLLDSLRKSIPFAQCFVVTTLPRGDLQIVQPANVSESLLKAYASGLHAEDRLTWQSIVRGEPVNAHDCWDGDTFTQSAFFREVMTPAALRYAAAIPLEAPVLPGYPGAVHVFRTEEQGDFSKADLAKLAESCRKFDEGNHVPMRPTRSGRGRMMERPPLSIAIVDEKLRPQLAERAWSMLDERLRSQLGEYARKQMHGLNGHPFTADRLQLPDSHGDHWVFRQVTYRHYPALSDGPVTFFCLQPDCNEWATVKAADFQADPEISRLIPAMKFMSEQFSRGPTLTEISRTVNLSPFHFHRRFTELLGLTPKQFMLNCQIHDAKAELLSGEKELVQIAKSCGFAHQSHFTSRFKQATGLTPTRWRRMAQERNAVSDN